MLQREELELLRWRISFIGYVVAAVLLVLLLAATGWAAATGYHLLKEIKVGGDGGWDYLTVDSAARRLYVSHATHVAVVDMDGGKVVGNAHAGKKLHRG